MRVVDKVSSSEICGSTEKKARQLVGAGNIAVVKCSECCYSMWTLNFLNLQAPKLNLVLVSSCFNLQCRSSDQKCRSAKAATPKPKSLRKTPMPRQGARGCLHEVTPSKA